MTEAKKRQSRSRPIRPRTAKIDIAPNEYDARCYWVPISWAAAISDRPITTVIQWVAADKVEQRVINERKMVWLWDVCNVSDTTPRRKRVGVAPLAFVK